MAENVIKTRIQFRRDTTANWEQYEDIIPAAGEPCFDIELGTLKIGDGIKTYGELDPIGGSGSVVASADGTSVAVEDGVFKLVGFDAATVGQIPQMGAEGKLIWSNIALRRDNDYNYKKIENTLIPINGEVCFVDVAGYGIRAKVGNGVDTFAQLPYMDETILRNMNNLIVKGYFYMGKFYVDAEHAQLLEDIVGRIYIDVITSKLYTYNGVNYETPSNSLPSATAEMAGAVKLYDTKGKNVDGTITQRLFTDEIDDKVEIDVVPEDELIIFDTDFDS